MNIDQSTIFLIAGLTAAVQMLTVLQAAFLVVVCFRYGSSLGSRAKDAVIAGQLAPPAPVAVPAPMAPQRPLAPTPATAAATPVPAAPPAAAVPTMILTGKMSVFGGPNDTGMAPDEGLALYEASQSSEIAGFLLPQQPPGTTGLGRRLDPSKFYIACRFDYAKTPKSFLRTAGVHVTAQGKTINCRPVDWGPAESTGRIADLSPGAAAALGIHTDDTVTVTIPLPSGVTRSAPASAASVGEPAWLAWARHEIGQHEDTDNTGPVVQKYIDLAHCGAQHDPWCAIFANAALEANGIPGTRSAAAQSFCTDPKFLKLEAPRIGALAVFWRGSRSSGQGHVGFYVGEDSTHVQVLGGNENDQVMIEPIPKNGATMGLLGYWWPVSPPSTTAEPKLT
jgi:uncharacterized protein (TIGR02594 family)